jgi:hypothetical protein
MDAIPRRFARYRTEDGRRWDTRHYDEDGDRFEADGRTWVRTAVTERCYNLVDAAAVELNQREAEAAAQLLA